MSRRKATKANVRILVSLTRPGKAAFAAVAPEAGAFLVVRFGYGRFGILDRRWVRIALAE